jgi:hypothetical protein
MKLKVKDVDSDVELLALDILDFAVQEGKVPVHSVISSKDFLSNLISVLRLRDAPEVQVKILYLIQKWGIRFETQKDIIPNFTETYRTLKNNNVIFPENSE